MFCPKCGTACTDEAAFCHKCGKDLPKENAAEPKPSANHAPANDVLSVFPDRPVPAPVSPTPPEPQSTKRRTWTTIGAVFFLFTMYFNIIDRAFSGVEIYTTGRNQVYVLFFGGLFCWWLFKSQGFNKWIGGTLGVGLSFVVLVAGVTINNRTKNSLEYVMANTPQIAALQKHHPQEYVQIGKDITEAKSRGAKPEELLALVNATVMPLALKAIQSTSDAALFGYGQTRLLMFRDVAAKSSEDCVMLISGKAQDAGPAVAARILANVSEETKTATRKSIARVMEDEGQGESFQDNADARFEKLFKRIEAKLKAGGTSAYYFRDDTKSANVQCKAGLGLYDEVMSLPVPDRSFMLRRLFGVG